MNNSVPDVRFVVLFHTCPQGDHFDLMIESGERLATWKISDPPESAAERPLPCRRIGDHRRMYLDYEGPISGDRGRVTQSDAGRCVVIQKSDDVWDLTFSGSRLAGRYILERIGLDDQSWLLRFVSRMPNG